VYILTQLQVQGLSPEDQEEGKLGDDAAPNAHDEAAAVPNVHLENFKVHSC